MAAAVQMAEVGMAEAAKVAAMVAVEWSVAVMVGPKAAPMAEA